MKAEYHKKANLRIVLRANEKYAVQTRVLERGTPNRDCWENLMGAGKLSYPEAARRMTVEAPRHGG